jgi:hypothetical protein
MRYTGHRTAAARAEQGAGEAVEELVRKQQRKERDEGGTGQSEGGERGAGTAG